MADKVRTRMLAIPGDTNGWSVVANEIKDKSNDESTDHPKKWLLSDEDEEGDIVIKTNLSQCL